MTKPLTRAEVEQLARSVGNILGTVRRGEVSAGPATVRRLEGALVGLGAALDQLEDQLTALLREPGV